jgi:anti-anti-sigma regulatory factor
MPSEPYGTLLITLTVSRERHRADIALSGEVDLPACSPLADVADLVAMATPQMTVIDVAGVTFAGSVLVNFLAKVQRGIPAESVLVVCRPTPIIHRVLTLTGTDLFAIVEEPSVHSPHRP